MNFADREYTVAKNVVQADHRERFVRLLIVLALALFSAGTLVIWQRQRVEDYKHFKSDIQQLIANGMTQSRIQNEETRRYITCLLVLPIETRTIQVQEACFDKGDVPGGLEKKDFLPIVPTAPVVTQGVVVPNQVDSYTDTSQFNQHVQSNTSQGSSF